MDIIKKGKIVKWAIQIGILDKQALEAALFDLEKESSLNPTSTISYNSEDKIDTPTNITEKLFPELVTEKKVSINTPNKNYQIISMLGEGGMGRVYKAYDPLLKRHVALKFLYDNDPKMVERLLREGRTQAKIEHPNVCKVYEVGQSDGRYFIVMQYLSGRTLKEIISELTLQEKIQIIAQLADALHTAHKVGLVHRDIKPRNIIVERTDDGSWKPYLLDFGVAREGANDVITMTGFTLGTPAYMSPEQAEQAFGEKVIIDHRTDIYSLGITFYELLVGQCPFERGTTTEILLRVIKQDPIPLIKISPKIPKDLCTIVDKCLEKDPNKRYESAKALTEDIQRYLNGDPIKAKPSSLAYRLVKKFRKNPSLIAISCITTLIIIVLAIANIQTYLTLTSQAHAAEEFEQTVKQIEILMRYSHMLPIHDTNKEKRIVRQQIELINQQMQNLGSAGQGPGNYALGRGYLALGDYKKAQFYLEKALNNGYKTSDLNYTIGYVLGNLYQKQLTEAQKITNKELQEKYIKDSETTYKDTSLQYLKSSSGKNDSPLYVESLIAFYEKHYELALQKAAQAYQTSPWLYEAVKLQAEIWLAMSYENLRKGNLKEAEIQLQQAKDFYQVTSNIARSDSTIYRGLALIELRFLNIKQDKGELAKTDIDKVLAICEQAIICDPEDEFIYNIKAGIYLVLSTYQSGHSEDSSSSLDIAMKSALKACELAPMEFDNYNTVAVIYFQKALLAENQGKDPLPSLNEVIKYSNKAIEINPNYPNIYNTLGIAISEKADYQVSHFGIDPQIGYQEAIKNYKKAIELLPSYNKAYNNIGLLYTSLASYQVEHNIDAHASIDAAIYNYQQAIKIIPDDSFNYNNLGIVYGLKGNYLLMYGQDPSNPIELAIDSYQKAIKLNSDYPYPYTNLADIYNLKAEYALEKGENPEPFLETALEYNEKSLSINNKQLSPYKNICNAYTIWARYYIKENREPSNLLENIQKSINKALTLNQTDYKFYFYQANKELLLGQWELTHHKTAIENINKAQLAINKALSLNDKDIDNYITLAKILRLQAIEKLNKKYAIKADLENCLSAIDKSLKINSHNSEAIAIKASILNLQAQIEIDEKEKNIAQQASQELWEQAIKLNSLIKNQYTSSLENIF